MKELKTIKIQGQDFALVAQRRGSDLFVYKSGKKYLRIGKPAHIKRELEIARAFAKFGFPIPKILAKGSIGGSLYYIEESLGDEHFGNIFAEDVKKMGKISEKNFKQYLAITEKFVKAQLKTKIESKDFSKFATVVHVKDVISERPDLKSRIERIFAETKKALSIYPIVLTHGDFNPHNLYPKGVIDFEEFFYAPAGYDIVTNIFHIEYFPSSKKYEFYAGYKFTKEQKKRYLEFFDKLFTKRGLPAITPNIKYFEFCRAVWLVARMSHLPKLQQYRYKLFIKRYL